jgi:hypothetical protein
MIVMLTLVSQCWAQGPFDSACYRPDLGNPDEFDTIYGGSAYQHLGQNLAILPPLKDDGYDRLVFLGMPKNMLFLSEIKTGSNFDLHSLSIIKNSKIDRVPGYRWGHFRSPKYLDLLEDGSSGGDGEGRNPKIYWADDNGDFDTSRYTLIPPYPNMGGGAAGYLFHAYAAYLSSDTVEDIVFSLDRYGIPIDTLFIAYVKGGQQLYDKGKFAYWDDKIFWGYPDGSAGALRLDSNYRFCTQGDWRGVGREDLIAISPDGIYFYYKNDPPFSLQKVVNAMKYDTLMDAKEWPDYKKKYLGISPAYPINAFPKASSDRSTDVLIPMPLDPTVDDKNSNGMCFYKGGPNFGSKRLYFAKPDFFLHAPSYYSGDFYLNQWWYNFNSGDLTGTGNTVLVTSGGAGIGYGFFAFYVLGKALDDKVDVFIPFHYGGSRIDTITTTNENHKSIIWGAEGFETPEDQANDIHEKGSVRVLKGIDKIPVRLSSTSESSLPQSRSLEIFPNPSRGSFTLTTSFESPQPFTVTIHDLLGRVVYTLERFASGGNEAFHITLPRMPVGTYFLELSDRSGRRVTKLSLIE